MLVSFRISKFRVAWGFLFERARLAIVRTQRAIHPSHRDITEVDPSVVTRKCHAQRLRQQIIAPRPPGLVRGAGRGAGHLGQEELTGVRDFETINHALFLVSSLVGGPGSTHLSVFDSALRALCSTQRGLLVHVGRPHERGALRGERARRRSSRRARRRTRRQRRRGRPISRHRCRSRCLTRCSTGSRARRTRAKLRSDGPSGLGGRVRSPAGPALRRSTGVRARA